jgi:glycosyltransferase involved in cell wall biosynthesis
MRTSTEPLYVEASPLLTRQLTGIGRFVARLVQALARRRPLRLFCTIHGEHARRMKLSTALVGGQELPLTPDLIPGDEDLGVWARRLLHGRRTAPDTALARQCTALYTMLRPPDRHFRRELCLLYDFTPLLLPWAHVADTREHFGAFFGRSSGRCDKALAISRSTKLDARYLSALDPADVVVGYPGPSLCMRMHAFTGPVYRRSNLMLVVSTLEPRKNGAFLLDWFQKTDVLPPDMELCWVGPRGWICDVSKRRAGKSRRAMRFLGMVSDRRLCELYQQATVTAYPSLYEGFGFPVLDSLRHGTRVMCSFNSSLEEFDGPGVHYFDAGDPATLDDAWVDAQQSQEWSRDDLEQRFSWDRLAEAVLSLC